MPDSIKSIKQDLTAELAGKRRPSKSALLALLKRAHALGKAEGGGSPESAGAVLPAAQEWVAAEAFFRLGPNAYDGPRTRSYLNAEADLRKALTGHADLRAAGEALGCVLIPLYHPGKRRRRGRGK